jgi:hypothetical protein
MHLSGQTANITFICTKSDDASVDELTRQRDSDDKLAAFTHREQTMTRELDELKDAFEKLRQEKSGLQVEIDKLFSGNTRPVAVGATQVGLKRPRAASPGEDYTPDVAQLSEGTVLVSRTGRPKRQCTLNSASVIEIDDEADDILSQMATIAPLLTQGEVSDEPEAQKDETRSPASQEALLHLHSRILDIQKLMDVKQHEVKMQEADLAKVAVERKDYCIKQRNDYVKGRMQQDFAQGFRE